LLNPESNPQDAVDVSDWLKAVRGLDLGTA
jgi:hypothetical protein